MAATERAIPIASRVKVSLSIIDIPSGKDPDELIKQDPALWTGAIAKNQYALDWLIARYRKLLDLDSAQGKREFSDVLLPVVRSLADDVEKDHYMNLIAKTIDVSRDALEKKFIKTTDATPAVRRRQIKTTPAKLDKAAIENQRAQDHFLCLVLMRMTLREFLNLVTPEMLYTDDARELLEFLKNNPDFDGKQGTAVVRNLQDYVKIESLLYEELYQGLELNELHYEAARLQARLVETFVKTEKIKLADKLTDADQAATRDLLNEAKQYDELLNKVKGAARGQS